METMPHHLAAQQHLPPVCQGLGQQGPHGAASSQLPISPLAGKDPPQSQGLGPLSQGLGPFSQGPGNAQPLAQSQGLAQGHPSSSSHAGGRRRRGSHDYHHR